MEPEKDFAVGSFVGDYDYGIDGDDDLPETLGSEAKPKIILMGLRRSGKSSIQKVVFHKMSPNETLFLESTAKPSREDICSSSFVQFQIWDFPGQLNFFDSRQFDTQSMLSGCTALIYVIDAQDDYTEALRKLHQSALQACKFNPSIKVEVFIHKVDGLSDDQKIDIQRDIYQQTNAELAEGGVENVHISFYLTSIYDHSIFEAFSKVVQKLIPQLPTLENLLNILISNSVLEKAYLFDVASKIYVATDSSPVDMQSYELCCDMIDVILDVSSIYGVPENAGPYATSFDSQSSALIRLNNNTVLYLRQVNQYLALVCIARSDSFERQGLIDYNFHCFKQAILEVFEVRQQADTPKKNGTTRERGRDSSMGESDSQLSSTGSPYER